MNSTLFSHHSPLKLEPHRALGQAPHPHQSCVVVTSWCRSLGAGGCGGDYCHHHRQHRDYSANILPVRIGAPIVSSLSSPYLLWP